MIRFYRVTGLWTDQLTEYLALDEHDALSRTPPAGVSRTTARTLRCAGPGHSYGAHPDRGNLLFDADFDVERLYKKRATELSPDDARAQCPDLLNWLDQAWPHWTPSPTALTTPLPAYRYPPKPQARNHQP